MSKMRGIILSCLVGLAVAAPTTTLWMLPGSTTPLFAQPFLDDEVLVKHPNETTVLTNSSMMLPGSTFPLFPDLDEFLIKHPNETTVLTNSSMTEEGQENVKEQELIPTKNIQSLPAPAALRMDSKLPKGSTAPTEKKPTEVKPQILVYNSWTPLENAQGFGPEPTDGPVSEGVQK
ncbi:Hypothetical predicted protein [Xyrichtys novacula]|uniref:Uncharacterized protein n=1 Tax=Xyrichtys novacula TaxID=13765 RepID=A0AAV1H965_XYRNO|nr:Hypothetical predicted protein [Xyrichtys novacula]